VSESPSIAQALAVALEHQRAGRLAEAESIYRQILKIEPRNVPATHLLGLIAHACGKPDIADNLIASAIAINPKDAKLHSDRSVILANLGRLDDAAESAMRAIKLDPDNVAARNNLGSVCRAQGQLDEAITWFETALKRNPDHVDTLNNFGLALKDAGQIDRALEMTRRALALWPAAARIHSNVLLMLHYLPGYHPESVYAEHLAWAERHARPLESEIQPFKNQPDLSRRLRVGYVSPDFCAHPVAYFIEPLLSHRDAAQLETFCYYDNSRGDEVTRRLHGLADQWRSVAGTSDAALAELVRRDQIDILVDLSGHTGEHRLLAFARKPAPVQITYLGYCDTTGMQTMDYIVTDSVLDPAESPDRYSERLIRLAGGFSCFTPPSSEVPVQSQLDLDAPVTFGAMPLLAKINAEVIDLWADIMRSVPHARLLLYRNTLRGRSRQRLIDAFSSRDIDVSRLDFRSELETKPGSIGARSHLALYRQVDICLDTFPWSGHTSACEALWMGTPVITLLGLTRVGRMVASVLHQANHSEWVAQTRQDYVTKAVELSRDPAALRQNRAALRDQVIQSSLCDARSFVRGVESAFRGAWEDWCQRNSTGLVE
jgi:predicted O-linked N-acetylglucosamine transferase (SPINDLY family)